MRRCPLRGNFLSNVVGLEQGHRIPSLAIRKYRNTCEPGSCKSRLHVINRKLALIARTNGTTNFEVHPQAEGATFAERIRSLALARS